MDPNLTIIAQKNAVREAFERILSNKKLTRREKITILLEEKMAKKKKKS